MRPVLLFPLLLLPGVSMASDADAPAPVRAELSLSRHYTDNALDEPLAVSDSYTLMRGTISGDLDHALGQTRITLDGELRRHDLFTIENDAAGGIESQTTLRPSENLELRGTLFLRRIRDGDALVIEDLAIGTETTKTVGGAGAVIGLRLTPSLVSTTELKGFRERAGDTFFEDDLILPTRFEPDRDRIFASQGLTRTDGRLQTGLRAEVERTTFAEIFDDPVELDRLQLRGEIGWRNDEGYALALAAGGEWLRASFDLIDVVRPSIEATAVAPIAGMELRGTLRTGFDSDDTDDLLASWVRRAQVELAWPIAERIAFSTGVFVEARDNLVLDYSEDRRGIYGEIGWQTSEQITLVLRLDYREDRAPGIDFAKDRLDASLAMRTRL
jgi:hypothetical protein